jgi:hypothetical protein
MSSWNAFVWLMLRDCGLGRKPAKWFIQEWLQQVIRQMRKRIQAGRTIRAALSGAHYAINGA